VAYDGGSFQMVTPEGQSAFAAGLQAIAPWMAGQAADYNQRSQDSVNTFKAENADLYGAAYKQKLAEFSNDPSNRNAMHRFGNQLPQEHTENAAAQLARTKDEYALGVMQRGAQKGANYNDRIEFIRISTGRQPLMAEVKQAIVEDLTTPEEQKQGILIELGIKPHADVVYKTDAGKLVAELDRAYKVGRDKQLFAIASDKNKIAQGGLELQNRRLQFDAAKAWQQDQLASYRLNTIKQGLTPQAKIMVDEMARVRGDLLETKYVNQQKMAMSHDDRVKRDLSDAIDVIDANLLENSRVLDEVIAGGQTQQGAMPPMPMSGQNPYAQWSGGGAPVIIQLPGGGYGYSAPPTGGPPSPYKAEPYYGRPGDPGAGPAPSGTPNWGPIEPMYPGGIDLWNSRNGVYENLLKTLGGVK